MAANLVANWQPRDSYERAQLRNYKFYAFRRLGKAPSSWTAEEVRLSRSNWIQMAVPRPIRPAIFTRNQAPWVMHRYRNPSAVAAGMPDIEDPTLGNDPWVNSVKTRLANAKEYFNNNMFRFQKVLGYGGLGLALHFRHDGDQTPTDVAMKLSLKSWVADDLRKEEQAMAKLTGAVHAVQLVDPEEVGVPRQARYHPMPTGDDSSSSEDSSGDESIDYPRRPPRLIRGRDTPADQHQRARDYERRRAQWIERNDAMGPRKDFILLEYIEGGDLRMLINKIGSTTGPGQVARIPNRVLWAMWLCLVRACVGMKYPPRKFHPERFARSDLIEDAPPARKRWRGKNMVHFDIDPSNILIGNIERPEDFVDENSNEGSQNSSSSQDTVIYDPIEGSSNEGERETPSHFQAMMSYFTRLVGGWTGEPSDKKKQDEPAQSQPRKRKYDVYHDDRTWGEHIFIPKLKLGDFGLAQEIKSYKRNDYYVRRRATGKYWFYAPEQFGAEWERIPADPDGQEAGENQIAGRYCSATNVWGIALTMWVLITQRIPPMPPQAQIPPGINIPKNADRIDELLWHIQPGMPVSYCALLMDGDFEYIDEDLRTAIYQCMYHQPNYRPTVEELLLQAQEGISRRYPDEDDDVVNRWVSEYVLNAPTS
ncbi:kinase-like domain-containing protein [Daldinia caldariorum]|uniref:kinase-like domain-containing protein n=1 Tax=Daldinia caldariorum TaxID=326644 RepID=UPI0020071F18|nr:kinase-like domain-containing protein [Daldinia caldariorum]KAI1468339.1 kinase-like domain-containing protein [Daldinia caldariorum]